MPAEPLSSTEPTIVITKRLPAPRDLVWSVFTNPEHVRHWYGGHGFENPVCEMDVRPGGVWTHVMRVPDGTELNLSFVFVEVEAPEKLVWKHSHYDTAKPEDPPAVLHILTLEEIDDGTRSHLVSRFKTMEARDRAAGIGFASVIDEGSEKLAELVNRLM